MYLTTDISTLHIGYFAHAIIRHRRCVALRYSSKTASVTLQMPSAKASTLLIDP